ncbi:DNA processing protein [Bacillus ectoiniformans]|uniref:DNA-processing protein DprA n=1 Tax=Bacillus ectoiniformans TaxID=1494429 RepID=UPI00195D91C7|nr:DNA-processing protein DprA [Bacillus ectoiniformans]MBM7647144.1 DNA processing protein [Bacillus ectoiniformans]
MTISEDSLAQKIIHLQLCDGIGWKSIYYLLKKEADLKNLYSYSPAYLSNTLSISSSNATKVLHQLFQIDIHSMLKSLENNRISFIPIDHPIYPELLLTLPQPPWGLYAMGDLKLLENNRKLAIVGARKADDYGRTSLQTIMPDLVKNDCVIVSGLAKGIDTIAHSETIRLGGKTIAVIAGGFSHIYPKENIPLVKEIIKNHLLLSEYPPTVRPARWQFPARNRLISGLSLGTVVVQADERSGSLITAYCALDQGRDVFAVPGPIDDPLSKGTNTLISEGAKIVRTSEDILSELRQI